MLINFFLNNVVIKKYTYISSSVNHNKKVYVADLTFEVSTYYYYT